MLISLASETNLSTPRALSFSLPLTFDRLLLFVVDRRERLVRFVLIQHDRKQSVKHKSLLSVASTSRARARSIALAQLPALSIELSRSNSEFEA